MKNLSLLSLGFLAILLLVIYPVQDAHSFMFKVSDLEWKTWQPYCKARYVGTSVGSNSKYAKLVSKEEQERWRNYLGEVQHHIHHYCAGLTYLTRARFLAGSQDLYKNAVKEMVYTYDKANLDTPIYSEISANYGLALYGAKRRLDAFKVLKLGITRQPSADASYIAIAAILTKEKSFQEAIEYLESGHKVIGEKSPKLIYRLGDTYFKSGDYSKARYFAKKAAELGYSAPGLKKRLKKIGQWNEE